MEDVYFGKSHRKWRDYYASKMNQETQGTERWEQYRKIFAWLANKVREKEKLDLLK